MLRKLVRGLFVVLVVAVGVGSMMPTQWQVERGVVIAAPVGVVFPLIDDLQRWPEWTAWDAAADPTLRRSFGGGRTTGVGAAMTWAGDDVGEGTLKIAESVPGRLVGYELELEHDGLQSHGVLELDAEKDGLHVTWRTEGELGWNPLVRLMGPWIEQAVGSDFDRGLAGLKRMAEGSRT